jgi:methyl-accepting chemotaxis protein
MHQGAERLMDRKTIVVVFCSILPLVLITFVAGRQTDKLSRENSVQIQMTRTEEELEAVALTLSRAESAEQGFVLTGKEDLLAPATTASAEIQTHLRRLERLFEKSPEQSRRLKDLAPLIQERLNIIATIVVTRKQKGFDAAVKLFSQSNNEQLTKQIRILVSEMEEGERKTANQSLEVGKGSEELKKQRLFLLAGFLLLFMIGSNLAFARSS